MRNNTRKVINYSHHSTTRKKIKKSQNHTGGFNPFSRFMRRTESPTPNKQSSSGIQTAEFGEENFKNIIIENYQKLNNETKNRIDVAIVLKIGETYKIDFLASEALASQLSASTLSIEGTRQGQATASKNNKLRERNLKRPPRGQFLPAAPAPAAPAPSSAALAPAPAALAPAAAPAASKSPPLESYGVEETKGDQNQSLVPAEAATQAAQAQAQENAPAAPAEEEAPATQPAPAEAKNTPATAKVNAIKNQVEEIIEEMTDWNLTEGQQNKLAGILFT